MSNASHNPLLSSKFAQHIVKDGGLAAVLGADLQQRNRELVLGDQMILNEALKYLQRAFGSDPLKRRFLDPFAPAAERNAAVVETLRVKIRQDKQHGGIFARLPPDEKTLLRLFAETLGWGPAQPYLDDPRVNEVKIIGQAIRVQEAGKAFVTVRETFASWQEVLDRARLLASLMHVRLDKLSPQVTIPLGFGTRMHVSIPDRVVDGVLVCIRRGRNEIWDLGDVRRRQTFDSAVEELLKRLCEARCSILISGRTGTGKTALLEALANSWPGDPHTVTIEDHAQEIFIRRSDIWTRELVDSYEDPEAFGSVAREALRQTPDLLLPGEIRDKEAGAVLTMVLTDHPVITTIHARSPQEALERFARCAARPGAYMYQNQPFDALMDTCTGFDVVIQMDIFEEIGRRVITEVALPAGLQDQQGTLRPRLVPLVEVDADPDTGVLFWKVRASINPHGSWEWADGKDETPKSLQAKLRNAHVRSLVRAAGTTLDVAQRAHDRAAAMLQAGESERALATLEDAWRQRHDGKLLTLAQKAIAGDAARYTSLHAEGQRRLAHIDALSSARSWPEALAAYSALLDELPLAAAVTPAGGWGRLADFIRANLARVVEAEQACEEAQTALQQDQPRAAMDRLQALDDAALPGALELRVNRLREQAVQALLARGQTTAEALQAIRARITTLQPGAAAREDGGRAP